MAQLSSSPALNMTTGARLDTPSASVPGVSKPGDSPQDFAQMIAGVMQSQTAAQSTTATTAAGSKPGAASQARDLIKSLQVQIHDLQGQKSLPANVSASLTALQQQLVSLQQKLGTLGTSSGAGGQTMLDALVTQLQKIRGLLTQNTPMDAAWIAQLQSAAMGLNPESPTTASSTKIESTVTGQGGRSMPAGAGGAGNVPASSSGTQSASGNDISGSSSSSSNPMMTKTNEQMNTAIIGSNQSNNAQVNNSVNNLVQASVLMSGNPNKKVDGAILTTFNSAIDSTNAAISGANSSGSSLSGFGFGTTQAGNSPFPALPSVLDLNQPKLADNMGQQIQWMMGKNISRATLELNPAQLGPLKITIDMQQNQTNIQVLAAHHLTRDMLEQSLPRLREFLQDAGLTNVQFSIGQDSAQGQGASQGQTANSGGQSSSGAAPGGVGPVGAGHEPASAGATTLSTTTWRLDTFA
ncbi:flagellar hook-length control protein FliK [Halothiobacillus sp.]|uniref:flagellar hook-length control protein FliK n=1 Tax=Halothiobacillus sp. TaxID=1891311 RepID=UPI002AD37A47|nr:flagellar hook-length control protein FliK [Halothiobacillus sp.]